MTDEPHNEVLKGGQAEGQCGRSLWRARQRVHRALTGSMFSDAFTCQAFALHRVKGHTQVQWQRRRGGHTSTMYQMSFVGFDQSNKCGKSLKTLRNGNCSRIKSLVSSESCAYTDTTYTFPTPNGRRSHSCLQSLGHSKPMWHWPFGPPKHYNTVESKKMRAKALDKNLFIMILSMEYTSIMQ